MGVMTNKNRSRSDSHCLEFNSELADLFFDQTGCHIDEDLDTSFLLVELEERKEARRQRKATPKVRRSRPEAMFRGLGCRGKGKKRFQRYENGNLLAQSIAHTFGGWEIDDLIEDINIYDFVARSVSAFAQLLMDTEKMMAWDKFCSSSEDVQNEFLARNPSRLVKKKKRTRNISLDDEL